MYYILINRVDTLAPKCLYRDYFKAKVHYKGIWTLKVQGFSNSQSRLEEISLGLIGITVTSVGVLHMKSETLQRNLEELASYLSCKLLNLSLSR